MEYGSSRRKRLGHKGPDALPYALTFTKRPPKLSG